MDNARGSGSGSGSTTTADDGSNSSPKASPLASGSGSGTPSGSSGCNFGTTVEFGYNGYMNTFEEVGCGPPTIQVPITANPGSCPVYVNYSTQDGTAIAGTDYTAVSGTASFQPYSTSTYWVSIPILDDGGDETGGTQSFYVVLSNAVNATLGNPSSFTVNVEEAPQQQAATDTLRWNPCTDKNASTVTNWYDVTQGFQLQKGATGPNASSPIQFDADPKDTPNSNAAITWDKSFTVASISVTGGYDALMTMTAPTTTDAGAFTMSNDSTLNVYFGNNAEFVLSSGGTIKNMTLSGDPSGILYLGGGTTEIAPSPGYKETTGVNIQVASGATLQDDSYNPLVFTNSKLTIWVQGKMTVFFGSGSGATLIDRNGFSQDTIDVNGGTLQYLGSGGVADTFDMNVLVEVNGTFKITSAGNGSSGASLTVKGDPSYYSVSMTSGQVTLAQGATLNCVNDYYQTGGSLMTMDTSTCTLIDPATAKILGGYLIIDEPNLIAGYGTFNIQGNLSFAGTLAVAILGSSTQGTCDVLNVIGTMTIQNGSGLIVTVNGNLVPGNSWVIIISRGALLQDFSSTNNAQTGLTSDFNKPGIGEYQLKS